MPRGERRVDMDAQSTERIEVPRNHRPPIERAGNGVPFGEGTEQRMDLNRPRGGTLIELGMEETDTSSKRAPSRRGGKTKLRCRGVIFIEDGSTIQFGSSCFDERGGRIGLVCEK